MRAYIITESYVRNIIRHSTADERAKYLLQSAVTQENTLLEFVYEVLCYHMPAYNDPTLPSHSYDTPQETFENFAPILKKISKDHIQIRSIDPFDALYNRSYPGMSTIFESVVLDSLYNAMEDFAGMDNTHSWFEEVVDLLEHIIITLETCFLSFTDSHEEIKLLLRLHGSTITVFLQ